MIVVICCFVIWFVRIMIQKQKDIDWEHNYCLNYISDFTKRIENKHDLNVIFDLFFFPCWYIFVIICLLLYIVRLTRTVNIILIFPKLFSQVQVI